MSACALFAEAMLITYSIDPMYRTLEFANLPPGMTKMKRENSVVQQAANLFEEISYFMKLQMAQYMVFWTCLWLVKASFLAFFRRLTNNLRRYVIAWWITVFITAISYCVAVITYPISCSSFKPRKFCFIFWLLFLGKIA